MDSGFCSFLNNLKDSGTRRSIPLIDDGVAHLLASLAAERRVRRVLELGTAIGYSTLWLAYGLGLRPEPLEISYKFDEPDHQRAKMMYSEIAKDIVRTDPDDARLVTVEIDVRRVVEAYDVFGNCRICGQVSIIPGNAIDVLPGLTKPFQLVFIDAGKSENALYLNVLLTRQLLDPGCILVVDNIKFREEKDTPRHRRIRSSIREFVSSVIGDPRWNSMALDIGDGILLARMQEQ